MVPLRTKVKKNLSRSPGRPKLRQQDAADPRLETILLAAYEVFLEKGISGATTLDIARRAHTSKREIYTLFGNKEALFTAMVRCRAGLMHQALALAPPQTLQEALQTLEQFGREFLALLTHPTTIAVYRLAIAEAGRLPEMGRMLDKLGRGAVWEALIDWFRRAQQAGVFGPIPVERAAGSFMALLMADLPVRLMLGAAPTPTAEDIAQRAASATAAFAGLWLGR